MKVIERFGSYTEISPSGTGGKVFFTYSTANLPAIRKAMGNDFGKQSKERANTIVRIHRRSNCTSAIATSQ